MTERLTFIDAPMQSRQAAFSAAILKGLSATPKSIPCRYFYDAAGSDLFEQICDLPEYYLTRTEQSILERYADEIVRAVAGEVMLVEFGSGSSYKTRILMNAALNRQSSLHYVPIDISHNFLYASAQTLLGEYPGLSIHAIAAEYNDGVEHVPHAAIPRLFLFLGSNIGNFECYEAVAFLSAVRAVMGATDRLLIGVDLVKPTEVLEAAYNDTAGVTEAFNKNVLNHINRELNADFVPERFDHHAPYVPSQSRIEMRLISRERQTVTLGALSERVHFEEGEYIHTENSHKYSVPQLSALMRDAGFRISADWYDPQKWFGVFLLEPVGKQMK
jgi:dimethylhistidine N-methyltransferase